MQKTEQGADRTNEVSAEAVLQQVRDLAIMLPTSRDYLFSFLAGGIPVPIYPPLRLHRLKITCVVRWAFSPTLRQFC